MSAATDRRRLAHAPALFDVADAPWLTEPDRLRGWAHGLKYCLLRNGVGAWCGYVRLPRQGYLERRAVRRCNSVHPFSQQPIRVRRGVDVPEIRRLEAHGGVNFASRLNPRWSGWWIGFDCAHYTDFAPVLAGIVRRLMGDLAPIDGVYRTLAYAREECVRLAAQIRAVEAAHVRRRRPFPSRSSL